MEIWRRCGCRRHGVFGVDGLDGGEGCFGDLVGMEFREC